MEPDFVVNDDGYRVVADTRPVLLTSFTIAMHDALRYFVRDERNPPHVAGSQ